MKIGIAEIGSYIPEIQDCREKIQRHNVDENFILKKTGFLGNAVKKQGTATSDLCVRAFEALERKCELSKADIDFVLVCTQNGDYRLPQTSAVVHGKLGLQQSCAGFDISLGCSGYVYALSVAKAFMEANGLRCGLIFTADPYSPIIDENDKNTDLLFGDAATVTLMTDTPVYALGKSVFDTKGDMFNALRCEHDGLLFMDGRRIFDFVLRYVPASIARCLTQNAIDLNSVRYFLLHQASRYLLENLARRLRIEADRIPFVAGEYGNTISSSIPLALELFFDTEIGTKMLLSGFGVGLSMATTTIQRIK